MSYFPFIHMQVAWECWSWQRDGAGLSLHPSLLPTEPSPRHWFYWSSAGFSLPQCHPRSSVGSVVWGPIPQQLHPAGKDPQACFNIPLSHTEQELSASPAGGLSDHSWSSSPAPARCASVWPAGGALPGVGDTSGVGTPLPGQPMHGSLLTSSCWDRLGSSPHPRGQRQELLVPAPCPTSSAGQVTPCRSPFGLFKLFLGIVLPTEQG